MPRAGPKQRETRSSHASVRYWHVASMRCQHSWTSTLPTCSAVAKAHVGGPCVLWNSPAIGMPRAGPWVSIWCELHVCSNRLAPEDCPTCHRPALESSEQYRCATHDDVHMSPAAPFRMFFSHPTLAYETGDVVSGSTSEELEGV